jgi:hypothetical protein
MMVPKEPPEASVASLNRKFNWFALPKKALMDHLSFLHIKNPIRLEPFNDVIMAGRKDNATKTSFPDVALDGVRAALCHVTIYDGRELIKRSVII